MALYTIQDTTLTAIGDSIRNKTGVSELIEPENMAAAIMNISSGGEELPEEVFTITGDCMYRFAHNGWNWFIEKYGNRIVTENLTNISSMFYGSDEITDIPFSLNINKATASVDIGSLFYGCNKLTNFPIITNAKIIGASYLCSGCKLIRELPEEIYDTWDFSPIQTSSYGKSVGYMFYACDSLLEYPQSLLANLNHAKMSYYSSIYTGTFYSCFALAKIEDLPVAIAEWTSNSFNNTFTSCERLATLTFELENNAPKIASWKSQTIDLSNRIGYSSSSNTILNCNSGLTVETRITDAETYEQLKNNPDSWTTNINYSRYNHDSAVATINSLPDTSAYLATAGGTNTIKFKGAAGALTDGGAINTLTAEEIAVATAKGWTVTLV